MAGDEYQKCGNCIFWQEIGGHLEGPGVGNCRRYPPAFHPADYKTADLSGASPQTRLEGWCGEWSMEYTAPDDGPTP
jgi:hypothetical protein